MAARTAVLIDANDRRLGAATVPEAVFVIRHADGFFARSDKGIRLAGGGIGVVFYETEVVAREQLRPI